MSHILKKSIFTLADAVKLPRKIHAYKRYLMNVFLQGSNQFYT
jgi:hypothetical protein